jgi:uncharacterized membrane protein YbhN (UPF0104 family)
MYAAQVVFQIVAGLAGFLSLSPSGRGSFRALERGDSIAPEGA